MRCSSGRENDCTSGVQSFSCPVRKTTWELAQHIPWRSFQAPRTWKPAGHRMMVPLSWYARDKLSATGVDKVLYLDVVA
jgi:hypothetical protein